MTTQYVLSAYTPHQLAANGLSSSPPIVTSPSDRPTTFTTTVKPTDQAPPTHLNAPVLQTSYHSSRCNTSDEASIDGEDDDAEDGDYDEEDDEEYESEEETSSDDDGWDSEYSEGSAVDEFAAEELVVEAPAEIEEETELEAPGEMEEEAETDIEENVAAGEGVVHMFGELSLEEEDEDDESYDEEYDSEEESSDDDGWDSEYDEGSAVDEFEGRDLGELEDEEAETDVEEMVDGERTVNVFVSSTLQPDGEREINVHVSVAGTKEEASAPSSSTDSAPKKLSVFGTPRSVSPVIPPSTSLFRSATAPEIPVTTTEEPKKLSVFGTSKSVSPVVPTVTRTGSLFGTSSPIASLSRQTSAKKPVIASAEQVNDIFKPSGVLLSDTPIATPATLTVNASAPSASIEITIPTSTKDDDDEAEENDDSYNEESSSGYSSDDDGWDSEYSEGSAIDEFGGQLVTRVEEAIPPSSTLQLLVPTEEDEEDDGDFQDGEESDDEESSDDGWDSEYSEGSAVDEFEARNLDALVREAEAEVEMDQLVEESRRMNAVTVEEMAGGMQWGFEVR
ncbi:hypothetical protein BJ508DRAFT_325296 [Ascobolus immersus RN42]|uniref:Uncharacterized protein n=1 Tax=Ascobolus immersus RN42 TaxID=1160509 RepID=A0A3N4I8Z5_ASCIM|nr:hypothetical protein BJ508DRAFT_325296 [Ascobolus immersus RN42]